MYYSVPERKPAKSQKILIIEKVKMRHFTASIFLTLTITCMTVACAPFAPPERASLETELPATFSNLAEDASPQQRWWESFQDSELNNLINELLKNNLSLKEAWARLDQANALVIKSGADLYPDLNIAADASVGRRQTKDTRKTTENIQNYSLGMFSSYEIDLWGKIRSENEAAILSYSATKEDLNAAAMTLTASVAETWIRIISQRMQKQLLHKQLTANKKVLELIELRYNNSLASALDVFQQRQVVFRSEAQIPMVEQSEALLLNELNLLLGRNPVAETSITRQKLNIPEDIPKTGLPARLLIARPDVRAALLRLEASDWRVSVAQADRLPAIRLAAGASFQADEFDLLMENWLINLAAGITAPIYDGDRRKAEVDRTKAVVAENLAAYRQNVLIAIKEVEDAMISETKLREHVSALKKQLNASQNALNEADSRYQQGIDDYLPVLTQLISVQNLEQDIIARQSDIMIARVNLYRALGGTWTDELVPSTGSKHGT
jgi:NodT family efflux transporter outer membrane factor (OMF) lipoprotein